MSVIELTQDNFDATIENNSIVIVDFWASWCGPCMNFAPVYEAAAQKHADITFTKVNTEEQEDLAASFNIRSIPTLIVFREKVILYAEAGALRAEQLEQLIEQIKEVDMKKVHEEIAQQQKA